MTRQTQEAVGVLCKLHMASWWFFPDGMVVDGDPWVSQASEVGREIEQEVRQARSGRRLSGRSGKRRRAGGRASEVRREVGHAMSSSRGQAGGRACDVKQQTSGNRGRAGGQAGDRAGGQAGDRVGGQAAEVGRQRPGRRSSGRPWPSVLATTKSAPQLDNRPFAWKVLSKSGHGAFKPSRANF